MIRDNPAERLLNILIEGRKISQAEQCRTAWKILLEVKNNNESLLVSRLGKTMELPNQIIDELIKIEDTDDDIYKHWSACVNKGFMQQNLNDKWSTFLSHIDLHTIPYLKISKQLLTAHTNIRSMTQDDISKVKKEIEDLLNLVRESKLDTDVQSYLISMLSKMLNSIIEYKITGYKPITSNIDEIIGHAIINQRFREDIKSSDINTTLWTKLQNISAIVTLATGLPQLAKDAIKLLTN